MKNILIPTDFSKEAEYALDLGCQLANKANGNISLLHIIKHPEQVLLNTMGDIDLSDPKANEFIQQLINEAKNKMRDIRVGRSNCNLSGQVKIGDPKADLIESITSSDHDLIIVGTPRESDQPAGDHVIKIVRTARCPVITVKSPVNLKDINEIVFPANLLEDEGEVIEAITELQGLLKVPINVLKILTANDLPPDKHQLELMQSFAAKYSLNNYATSFDNAPTEPEGVLKFVSSRPGCLIALATHGRKGLAHYISGSVAEELALKAQHPVWTCVQKKAG